MTRSPSLKRIGSISFWLSGVLAACAAVLFFGAPKAIAQNGGGKNPDSNGLPREYHTSHFRVFTDLPFDEAQAMIERMEATLRVASEYWQRPPLGVIDCYVARNVDRWPDSALPHALALVLIGGVEGGTVGRSQANSGRNECKADIFATAETGIAEHEVVHAYCSQTFGVTGPDWYKEGMADMAYFLAAGNEGTLGQAHAALRAEKPRSVKQIVEAGAFTGSLAESVADIVAQTETGTAKNRLLQVHRWKEDNKQEIGDVRDSYRWAWALCHMLSQHPGYADRFRRLGNGYLTGQEVSYQSAFGDVEKRVDFEYEFFVRHAEAGYRVDLCRWDWDKKSRDLPADGKLSVKVAGARGYQASGLTVAAGQKYSYRARGRWKTQQDAGASTADGASDGQGRLMGVVLADFKLGEPFDLGTQGSFTAATTGELFLRCSDRWNELADNTGQMLVLLRRAKEAAP